MDFSMESHDLGGLPVDILKSQPINKNGQEFSNLILIIPGNPGIVRYYSAFIKALYKELNGSTAVWAISHSCHSSCDGFSKHSIHRKPLEAEIEHKLRFLEQLVPKNCNISLIGHSIGCYLILSVLEILSGFRERYEFTDLKPPVSKVSSDTERLQLLSRIKKCFFLFPTIERMKVSPNGRRLWPFLQCLQWLPVGLCTFFSWLPHGLRWRLASMVLGRGIIDPEMIDATVDLLSPRKFKNMLNLAYNELQTVDSLHRETVECFKDRIVFYFGRCDRWCPLSYRDDLVKSIPDVINYLDDDNVEHAFVLCHSRTMAAFLSKIMT